MGTETREQTGAGGSGDVTDGNAVSALLLWVVSCCKMNEDFEAAFPNALSKLTVCLHLVIDQSQSRVIRI